MLKHSFDTEKKDQKAQSMARTHTLHRNKNEANYGTEVSSVPQCRLTILYRALRVRQVPSCDRYCARNSSTVTGFYKDTLYM
jgi:hypothetical protein